MAGTAAGGRKAAVTNKQRQGEDFYKKIGAEGGKLGRTGGFYGNPELARVAGAKGGRISKRRKTVTTNSTVYVAANVKPTPLPKPRFFDFKYKRNLRKFGIK